jgi:tetratricopeptide (TPR) repeat protein
MLRFFFVSLAFLFLCGCSRNTRLRYLNEGDQLLRKGDYAAAEAKYKKALNADPRYGPAYFSLGKTLQRTRSYSAAADAFRRAIELLPQNDPNRSVAKLAIADIFVTLPRDDSRYAEVEQLAVALCKSDANSFDGRRLLGLISLERARMRASLKQEDLVKFYLDDSITELRMAERVSPGNLQVQETLARALAMYGSTAEAEQLFRTLIAQNKRTPALYAQLYRLLAARGGDMSAEQVLMDAIANVPEPGAFAVMLAAHVLNADPAQLPQAVQRLRGIPYPSASLAAGDFYVRANRPEDAEREYKACLALPQMAGLCRTRLLQIYFHTDRVQQALVLVAEILKTEPQNTDASLARTVESLSPHSAGDAQHSLERILLTDSSNYEAPFHLARAYLMKGEPPLARQYFVAALKLKPDLTEARLVLAATDLINGESGTAIQDVRQILMRKPDDVRAALILRTAERLDRGAAPDIQTAALQLAVGRIDLLVGSSGTSTPLPVGIDVPSMYLRMTPVDEAIVMARRLRSKQIDRTELASPAAEPWAERAPF